MVPFDSVLYEVLRSHKEAGMQRSRQLKVWPQVRENKTVKAGSLKLITPGPFLYKVNRGNRGNPVKIACRRVFRVWEAKGDNAGIY